MKLRMFLSSSFLMFHVLRISGPYLLMMWCVAAFVGMFVNIYLTSRDTSIVFSLGVSLVLWSLFTRSMEFRMLCCLLLYGLSMVASIVAAGPPIVFLVSTMG